MKIGFCQSSKPT